MAAELETQKLQLAAIISTIFNNYSYPSLTNAGAYQTGLHN